MIPLWRLNVRVTLNYPPPSSQEALAAGLPTYSRFIDHHTREGLQWESKVVEG